MFPPGASLAQPGVAPEERSNRPVGGGGFGQEDRRPSIRTGGRGLANQARAAVSAPASLFLASSPSAPPPPCPAGRHGRCGWPGFPPDGRADSLSGRSTCCLADSWAARALVNCASASARSAVRGRDGIRSAATACSASAILAAWRSASAASPPGLALRLLGGRPGLPFGCRLRAPPALCPLPRRRLLLGRRLLPGRCLVPGWRLLPRQAPAARTPHRPRPRHQARHRTAGWPGSPLAPRPRTGVGQRRLKGGLHLALDLKADRPAVPLGEPLRLGDQGGDQPPALHRQFPHLLPGQVVVRLAQRLAERQQFAHLISGLPDKLVDQPRAHRGQAQRRNGPGEIPVTGRAGPRRPLVAGGGELTRRERVQLLATPARPSCTGGC